MPRTRPEPPAAGTAGGGGLEQTRITGRRHQAHRRRGGLHTEVQDTLVGVRQQLPGTLEQHTELGLRMRRTDVLHDPLTAPNVLGDLHCRRSGSRPHPPDEHHTATLEPPVSA